MRLLLTTVLLLPAAASHANDAGLPLPFIAADQREPNTAPAKGPAGEDAIEVTGSATDGATTIAILESPAIATHHYVVRGRVKYKQVSGDGYLELWNDFGPQGEFFTRSLAPSGKMRKLAGSSDWREFELPFFAEPGMRPQRLTLNVVLPGAGKVTVAQAMLDPASSSGDWWTEPQAGLLGGALGMLLGTVGALIGLSSAWSRLRPLALPLYFVGLSISSVCLLAGFVALCLRQPWHVCYPLLLAGIIGVGVLGLNLWQQFHRLRADELRRITAVDA
jgi:hypothetical protein